MSRPPAGWSEQDVVWGGIVTPNGRKIRLTEESQRVQEERDAKAIREVDREGGIVNLRSRQGRGPVEDGVGGMGLSREGREQGGSAARRF